MTRVTEHPASAGELGVTISAGGSLVLVLGLVQVLNTEPATAA